MMLIYTKKNIIIINEFFIGDYFYFFEKTNVIYKLIWSFLENIIIK